MQTLQIVHIFHVLIQPLQRCMLCVAVHINTLTLHTNTNRMRKVWTKRLALRHTVPTDESMEVKKRLRQSPILVKGMMKKEGTRGEDERQGEFKWLNEVWKKAERTMERISKEEIGSEARWRGHCCLTSPVLCNVTEPLLSVLRQLISIFLDDSGETTSLSLSLSNSSNLDQSSSRTILIFYPSLGQIFYIPTIVHVCISGIVLSSFSIYIL